MGTSIGKSGMGSISVRTNMILQLETPAFVITASAGLVENRKMSISTQLEWLKRFVWPLNDKSELRFVSYSMRTDREMILWRIIIGIILPVTTEITSELDNPTCVKPLYKTDYNIRCVKKLCFIRYLTDLNWLHLFGYIDVGDECWRRNMFVTTLRCSCRFLPFWSPTSTIFLH